MIANGLLVRFTRGRSPIQNYYSSWICWIQFFFPQSLRLLLPRVWVFLPLTVPSDERLSKHRPPGLLIFIIRTSCRELFSRIGWDFVNSWKKQQKENEITFIYKSRGASSGGGQYLGLTCPRCDLRWCQEWHSERSALVSFGGVVGCVAVWCRAGYVDTPQASWAAHFIPFSPQKEFLSRCVIASTTRSTCAYPIIA